MQIRFKCFVPARVFVPLFIVGCFVVFRLRGSVGFVEERFADQKG